MPRDTIGPELERLYGDLDYVIPRLASEQGQEGAARTLSTKDITVKQSWVNRWLRNNGYKIKRVYVKKEKHNA